MIKLILESINNSIVRYRYYPEGRSDFGIVEISRNDGSVRLVQKPKDYFSMYACMAYSRLRDMHEANSFPEKDMVACY